MKARKKRKKKPKKEKEEGWQYWLFMFVAMALLIGVVKPWLDKLDLF
jgi:hypothetical protein